MGAVVMITNAFKLKHLEATPTGCAIRIVLTVVRPHTSVEYHPDVDVDMPLGLLKKELEDVIHVPEAQQQWVHNGAVLNNEDVVSAFITQGEAKITVNVLQAP